MKYGLLMQKKRWSLLLALATLAVALASAIPLNATFAGKNGRIAFTQGAGTGSDVFTMNPDGSDVRQLTSFGSSGGQTCCAAWSPDGKQLVFAAVDSANDNAQLWIMGADGSNQHLLLNDPSDFDVDPSFSPDGGLIVFSRCGPINCAIYRVQADGTGLTPITNFNPNPDVFDFWPAYSPDGKTIAFTSFNRNNGFLCAIYTVDANGLKFHLLTPPRLTAFQPDWSPDGTKIAFSVNNNSSTILDEEIWVMNADGSQQPVQVTNNNSHWNGYLTGPHDYSPSWSPKGNKIVLERDSPDFSSSGIYVINPDGSGQVLVLQGPRSRSMEFSARNAAIAHLVAKHHLKQIESGGFSPRWGPASE